MNVQAQRQIELRPRLYRDAPAVALALAPEQPVFCFAPSALHATISRFRAGFPGRLSYAVKANSAIEVLTAAAAAKLDTFDVASVAEMKVVQLAAPRARLHYHNPVKSRREIGVAFAEHGCRRFAVDDAAEIRKIDEVIGSQGPLELAVRFRLPANGAAAHDFSTKFGATPAEAAVLLKDVARRGHVPVLTFHPGSQCLDPQAYARHIAAAAEIAAHARIRLPVINVGGGFPAAYQSGPVPSPETFFAAIAAARHSCFGSAEAPALECEPGRGLVAPTMSLLTRIKIVKPERGELFLNDGIYGALMEMSQAPGLFPPFRALRQGRVHRGAMRDFVAYGPTCDPLDRLPGRLMLPHDIAEDDYVEFGTVGAYGAATATRFNGYGAASLIIVEQAFSGRDSGNHENPR